MYEFEDKSGNYHKVSKTSWKVLNTVLEVLKNNQNTKWYHIHDRRGISYAQFMYWCKKLEAWGYVESVIHGHNQHNGWTGFNVVGRFDDIWCDLTGVPF